MAELYVGNNPYPTDVRYGSTLVDRIMHGSTLVWQRKIDTEPYILYQNNKYYKVTDIVNNQYVKEELEPYYHGEIINCVVDYPLGVSATIDTMIEVWCTQMLSRNGSAYIGNAYNNNTNGTFKLYTNGPYETATALIFKFGSSSSSTSSETLSSTYDSFSYTCGRYTNTNSLISGSKNYVYYIKAGSINGYNGLVVEHSSQYNYNSVKTTPIQSFYQGTDEQSQLHLNFTTMGCQIKMYKMRVWHGNTIVRDLRFRFKNNTKTDANMYLWDDVTQSEITPVGTTNIKYYRGSGVGADSGLADMYSLPHDDKFSNYYTIDGTITENGVTYERLVNNLDSSDVIKGIQIDNVTPTLVNPVITFDDIDYSINMSCSTSGAQIYYTIDGTQPDYNISYATLYNSPINGFDLWDEMDANGYYIIKAQSYLNGTWSEVVEFDMSEL